MIRVVAWTVGWAVWFAVGALALLTFGCATTPPKPALRVDRTDEAAALVWAFYGAPGAVPRVVWVAPDCEKSGDRVGIRDPWGRCVGGWTLSDGVVYSIWQPGGTISRDTALAHELRHAALLRLRAPWPHHIEGAPVATVCAASETLCDRHKFFLTVVEQANARLRAAGL